MTTIETKLSPNNLRTLFAGEWSDNGKGAVEGLRLDVSADGETRSWKLRFTAPNNKRAIARIGGLELTQAAARTEAKRWHALVEEGIDPRQGTHGTGTSAKFGPFAAKMAPTFYATRRNTHDAMIEWDLALRELAPLDSMDIHEIKTAHVADVLRPIWMAHPMKGTILRSKLERIFTAAKASGLRKGENPAMWRDNLAGLLPSAKKLNKKLRADEGVDGHPWLPVELMPAYMLSLRGERTLIARCVEFGILCANRNKEMRLAEWKEFNEKRRCLVIDGTKMKNGEDHIVALSDAAFDLLMALPRLPGQRYIFPSDDVQVRGEAPKPFSARAVRQCAKRHNVSSEKISVHGFRETFKTWTKDDVEGNFRRDVAEVALSHKVGDATEQAYDSSTMIERRRVMMNAWAAYCGSATTNVVAFDRAA